MKFILIILLTVTSLTAQMEFEETRQLIMSIRPEMGFKLL